MTHFEIASSINTLMMMAGTDINDQPKTTSKFMNANDVDIALDFAVDTIMALLPPNDREAVYKLLGEDGRGWVDGYLEFA
jgi:hypothetical protein